jgi:hypothetical protein
MNRNGLKKLNFKYYVPNVIIRMLFTYKKHFIILLLFLIIPASFCSAFAETAAIEEHYIDGNHLVVHVNYSVTGSQTLELWVQDPSDTNTSYLISTKKVTGRGITTLVGECCFGYPNRFIEKTKECFCANPFIKIK